MNKLRGSNCQAQGQGQGKRQRQRQTSKLDREVGFVMGWSQSELDFVGRETCWQYVLISRIPPSEADIQAALASLAQKKGGGEAEAAPAEADEA